MVQTTIRLPKELYSMLKEKAKRKGLTLNAFLINALWEVAKGN
ncbi:toxin-antitoxin system HicB family antitoxin [Mediterraneibacter massiliensis]|nr:toxin-antitoxin system HicB family antitoxin [Mediterraneibacter massiliensis]